MSMDRSFEDAFFWALNYNGWEMHADAMREYLADPDNREEGGYVRFPRERSACVTKDDVIHDNPNSILWMCLVQMFGDYGTSPRYGWVSRPDEACAWLRERQRATYHCDQVYKDDGSLEWSMSDDEIASAASEWELACRRKSGLVEK